MANPITTKNQDLTEAFCQSENIFKNLLYIENFDRFCYYVEEKSYYRLFPYREMERKVYEYLKTSTSKNITTATVKDVVEQVKYVCYRKYPNFNSDYLSFTDQLYNTRTYKFEAPDRNKISFISVPVSVEDFGKKDGKCPPELQKFLDFIIVEDNLTPDKELQAIVQELFGYCLMPTTRAEATFFFVGDGANGKSKLLEVLRAVVGSEYVASQSIDNLTNNNFATSSLIGKRVNICTEEESSFVRQDKFKTLVSGEATTIEAKFRDSFTETLPVKFIFATNEMPSFSGFNHAFLRRIKIIPFKRTIKESERDTRIVDKILVELPEIYLWALQGMRRLIERDMQFSDSRASNLKARELEGAMASSVNFIRDLYEEDEEGFIPSADLYAEYKDTWCPQVGKKAVSRDKFFREVGRALDLKSELKFFDGRPQRGYHIRPIQMHTSLDNLDF